nr:DUF6000 family protein [Streptomyces harenosi]
MPFQHPDEVGYGYVIERYAARKDSGHARYLVLKSGRFLRPEWPHGERFAHHLIDDAATITDAELEALLGYEWRSRLTAAWLIGVDRRERFRERIGDLLLASEVCFSGSAYCFALARFGTHHADRFTQPDGLWDQWANALAHLHGHPAYTPVERRRSTDLQCEFANNWSRTEHPLEAMGRDAKPRSTTVVWSLSFRHRDMARSTWRQDNALRALCADTMLVLRRPAVGQRASSQE